MDSVLLQLLLLSQSLETVFSHRAVYGFLNPADELPVVCYSRIVLSRLAGGEDNKKNTPLQFLQLLVGPVVKYLPGEQL